MNVKHRSMVVVAAALAAALAAPTAAMALSGSLKLSGSTTVQPVAQLLANAYHAKNPSVKVTVAGGGSGVGIADVSAGRVNIGMSSADLTAAQKSLGLVPYAIARDALTIIVNKGNGVSKLTAAQVRGIFTGSITNWKQVGGANATIIACGREASSGTYTYLKSVLLNNQNQSSRVKTYSSNGLVRNAVHTNKYAVGYVGMAYADSTVKGLALNGVLPTRANAYSGKYKYVRFLWYVTKGKAKGLSLDFINYTLSKAGQTIVATEYLTLK
jgi:phosphate transport system substrate-binding protein